MQREEQRELLVETIGGVGGGLWVILSSVGLLLMMVTPFSVRYACRIRTKVARALLFFQYFSSFVLSRVGRVLPHPHPRGGTNGPCSGSGKHDAGVCPDCLGSGEPHDPAGFGARIHACMARLPNFIRL